MISKQSIAIGLIIGTALTSLGQDYGHLRRTWNWWEQFFLRQYSSNEFRTASTRDVSCIILLIHEMRPRGSWVILRDGHVISTNMPTAVYTMEGGRQQVLISTKALDYLCQAPSETNKHAVVGMATYCTSNGVVRGFRMLSGNTLESIPDVTNAVVVRVFEDLVEQDVHQQEAERPVGGDGKPAPQP